MKSVIPLLISIVLLFGTEVAAQQCVGALTNLPLYGDGISVPLGIASPISASVGGSGLAIAQPFCALIGEGVAPFDSVCLTQDQIMQGVGNGTANPVASQNQVLGAAGHYQIRNSPPVVSNCGSGAAIVGNDSVFQVSVGSGTVTSCTVTFNKPMPLAALCSSSSWINLATFTTLNPTMVNADALGQTVTISGQTTNADIGCEKVTVTCPELVQ